MKLNPSILLLSNREDLSTDYIVTKLLKKDICNIRINSEDIINWSFEFLPNNRIFASYKESIYDLTKIKSIFFRRLPTIFSDEKNHLDRNFINRERKEFIEGLALSINGFWINPIKSTVYGERKLFQLSLAQRLGLKIPKTIITNDPARAREFLRHNKNVIIKPISHGFTIECGKAYSIYTNKIDSSSIDYIDDIIEVPILLQENVDHRADIRVTIVGSTVFPVKIIKDDNSDVDWRRINIKKQYSVCKLPQKMIAQLIDLNKKMGLVYSAIDLLYSNDGEYIFLEVNPVGEWLWLEHELNIKIADTIINCLLKGK